MNKKPLLVMAMVLMLCSQCVCLSLPSVNTTEMLGKPEGEVNIHNTVLLADILNLNDARAIESESSQELANCVSPITVTEINVSDKANVAEQKISVVIANQTYVLTFALNETDAIKLTEEQISLINRNLQPNKTLKLLLEIQGGSYLEIIQWYYFVVPFIGWVILYGGRAHVYLTPEDAINVRTALAALNVILPTLATLLEQTILGKVVIFSLVFFITKMIEVDYDAISTDRNPDGSLDMWFDVTPYTVQLALGNSIMIIDTPRFTWLATLAGAYIIGTKRPNVWVALCAWDPYFTRAISIVWYIGPNHWMYYEVKSAPTGITFR